MKYKSNNTQDYFKQDGVEISTLVTIVNLFFLTLLLLTEKLENNFSSLVTVPLIIEFIYGVVLSILMFRNKERYIHLVPFLMLNWLVGCFCVNTFIPIFEDLPVWVYITTLLFCITNFFIYQKLEESRILLFLFGINGISYTLILYYTLYLIPTIPFSFIGIILLGIGFYGLVPAIVSIIHIVTICRLFEINKRYFNAFSIGFLAVLISLIAFTVRLNIESTKINKNQVVKSFDYNEDLPNYIKISQNLEPNFFNEILLKKDIVYKGPDEFFTFRGFNSFGSKQFNQRKIHNPFITIALAFCKELDLSKDDRISILKSNFDKRLETEEQLWSGEDLFTKNIKEDVKLYPDTRLAYTEITMDIACEKDSWRDQEAIYSFQLPEGSVATSLSLWVNGIERKGVLTTKEKAQQAYKQIVGVENRDPSLMQWKEGNKVVVRVFPVNYKLPRTFKCGFTTPLKVEDNEMKYQSLSIKGPNISNAVTISRIQILGNSKVQTSKDFNLENGTYTNQSTGLDNWNAVMPINKTLHLNSFVWKDKTYEIKDIQKTIVPFTASEIILDLNSNWTISEIESFLDLKGKQFYVYNDKEKKEITKENYKSIQSEFADLHYSLLPLYKITKNSLIITKSGTFSANFEELEESEYLKKIRTKTKNQNLKVINISAEINPFWQTIKEQKYVEYYQTTVSNSLKMIKENHFTTFTTAENLVNIESAKISIQENPKNSLVKNNGPNHIYRMYAFGKVLEEQVKIQGDTLTANKYVTLAKDANIVTPISSLIVLETDEDYKTNGIEKNVDTLGNASINNDGAVPEPYEWTLIFIGFTTLFFYYRKSKKQTS